MPHNLQVVTGRPFITFCFACKEKVYAGDVEANSPKYPVYADLNGEPWRAYYCAECAKLLKTE